MKHRYYLDTEFNSFGGSLISLGVVQHANPANHLYLRVSDEDIHRMRFEEGMDPWIEENILPVLDDVPDNANFYVLPVHEWGGLLGEFIYGEKCDITPHVFVDWPSDAMDFSRLLMTGPGRAVDMSHQTIITILRHVDIYPTSLAGAVQHNALWDAMAIRQFVMEMEAPGRCGECGKAGGGHHPNCVLAPAQPTTGEISVCDKCGAEYPSAPLGTIHKCGRCSGGHCKPKVN